MEAVAWDLGWKIALGLAVDERGWHSTTLMKFRARLLLHGKERLALERTLELALELGLLKGSVEQIVDSTPMLGAAATQDTVRLVRGGVNKLLLAVAGECLRQASELESGLEFDYREPNEKPDCDWRSRPAREAMLTRVAEHAERALRAVEAVPELIEQGAVRQAHALPARAARPGLRRRPGGRSAPASRHARGPHPCRSTTARCATGRKSQHQRLDGFSCTPPRPTPTSRS